MPKSKTTSTHTSRVARCSYCAWESHAETCKEQGRKHTIKTGHDVNCWYYDAWEITKETDNE